MKTKTFALRLSLAVVSLLALLGSGAAPAAAAGSTIVVATTLSPLNCGKYTTAQFTNLSTAVSAVPSGTILVCPGLYPTGAISIAGASKLTIKQALPGAGFRPTLQANADVLNWILATNSSGVTIDGF